MDEQTTNKPDGQEKNTPVTSDGVTPKQEDPKKGPDVDETNRHKYDDGKPGGVSR